MAKAKDHVNTTSCLNNEKASIIDSMINCDHENRLSKYKYVFYHECSL